MENDEKEEYFIGSWRLYSWIREWKGIVKGIKYYQITTKKKVDWIKIRINSIERKIRKTKIGINKKVDKIKLRINWIEPSIEKIKIIIVVRFDYQLIWSFII